MANYSDIKGFTVQTVSSDPVASQGAGGTWASGGDLNTARITTTGTSSSSTNSIIGGGYYLPPTVNRSVTEAYDGTSWSELSDHPISIVYGNGLGVKTAALIAGIDVSAAPTNSQTYTFDGSSWSAPGASLNTFKFMSATGGTTTAGIIAGGNTPPANGTTETWNGSSWTETTDLNTAKTNLGGGTGTSTALMAVGGTPATIEVYDGSSWTEIAEMNTSRNNTSKGGIVTAALVTNGYAGSNYPAQTELYDGTSWTEVGDTPIGIGYASNISSGSPTGQTDGVVAGGQAGTVFSATTLEWSAPATFTKQVEGQLFFNSTTNTFKETITDVPNGTWSSGGNTNQARAYYGGYADHSTQTETFIYGGSLTSGGPQLAQSENYNGTSWTEVADLNTARGERGAGAGTYASALFAGGQVQGEPAPADEHEQWDGSSWSEATESNTDRRDFHGNGPSGSSGMIVAGYDGSTYVANTEIWDGSSWTEVADLNTARYANGSIGSTTSSICAGGRTSSYVVVNESWDGSSWSEVADMSTGRQSYTMSGHTSTLGFVATGYKSPAPNYVTNVELWNGSSWTEINDVSTARSGGSGGGTAAAGIIATGVPPGSNSQITEEFTASLANKTITAS